MKENTKKPKVYIVSGAGLSAESGIKTFGVDDGMWEGHSIDEVYSLEGWEKDRQKVCDFYDARRIELADKEPNGAHYAIAQLKQKYRDNVVVLTQNVDDLLERAECLDVVHLHGSLTELKCEDCEHEFNVGYESQKGKSCPKCKSENIRHNVLMFGENAPKYAFLTSLCQEADMLIVVGSSGQVVDVGFLGQTIENSILNNLHKDPEIDTHFKTCLHEPATSGMIKATILAEEFLILQNATLKDG